MSRSHWASYWITGSKLSVTMIIQFKWHFHGVWNLMHNYWVFSGATKWIQEGTWESFVHCANTYKFRVLSTSQHLVIRPWVLLSPCRGVWACSTVPSALNLICNTLFLPFKCHPSTLVMFQRCCSSDLQWLRDVIMVCCPLVVKIVRTSHTFCFVDWQWCWLLQVMLCNPICVLGYTIASWRFFRERIEEEELSLIHFFAEDYVEYKKKVPTGLPFISGIRVN